MKKRTLFIGILIIALITPISFWLDNLLLYLITSLRNPFLNFLAFWAATFWAPLIYLILLGSLLLSQNKKRALLLLLLAVFTSLIFSYLLKYLILRPRPFLVLNIIPLLQKTTPSFPSTHAALAASTFFFLKKIKNKKIEVLFFALALIIAFSSFYAGLHYLSDILVGLLLGTIVSYLILKNQNRITKLLTYKKIS